MEEDLVPESSGASSNAPQSPGEDREETLQQAILYWRIANASNTPISERVEFLVSKGLDEDDIDSMIEMLNMRSEARKKRGKGAIGIPEAWKVKCGKSKKLNHQCPGQRERRVLQRINPAPGSYQVDNKQTKRRVKGISFGKPPRRPHTTSGGRSRFKTDSRSGAVPGPGSYDVAFSSLRKNGVHISQTSRDVAAKVLAYDGAKKESDYKKMGEALNRPFVGRDSPGPALYYPPLPKSRYEKSFSIGTLNPYNQIEKSKRFVPGPAQYKSTIALGKQIESIKRSASAASFGNSGGSRSDWIVVKKGPGPKYRTAGKEAVLSHNKRVCSGVKFGDVKRKYHAHDLMRAKSKLPDPGFYADGAAKTTLCRQVNSQFKNPGGTLFGSSKRPGLFFLYP